jgi:PPOX class probable F420-dependent enzyme
MTDAPTTPTSPPTGGPAARDVDPQLLGFATDRHRGVLVTLKRDGRPQLSNIGYVLDPDSRVARVSVTADRAKTRNLQRDPRASLHVTSEDFWAWAVLEGDAELTPVTSDPHDATAEGLVDYYRAISGEHPDWDEYRRAMVAERRLLVELHVTHAYGQLPRG